MYCMYQKPYASKHRMNRHRKFKKEAGVMAKEIKAVELTTHAMERCAERTVTKKDIRHTIKYGRVQKNKGGFSITFNHRGNTVIVAPKKKNPNSNRINEHKNKDGRREQKSAPEKTAAYNVVTVYKNSKKKTEERKLGRRDRQKLQRQKDKKKNKRAQRSQRRRQNKGKTRLHPSPIRQKESVEVAVETTGN